MGYRADRNNGVSGLVDLPGQSAKFIAQVYGFKQSITADQINSTGRGDSIWGETWISRVDGNLIIRGKVQLAGRPAPSTWIGELGTIALQFHNDGTTTSKMTVSVRVVGQDFKKDAEAQDVWDVSLVCKVTTDPTWAGFGDAISAGTETHSDKETYEGLYKGIDPNALQTTGQQRFLIYGTDDTDAAEITKIASLISGATTPVTNGKLRLVGWNRLSSSICVATFAWGLTDTVEDIENPGSVVDDDASNIADTQNITKVQGSSTPSAPSTPSGLKLVHTETQELNDNKFRHTFYYARRNREDDIEMGGSSITDDPSDLVDTQIIVEVQSSSTPTPPATPSGLVLRSTRTSQIHGASGAEKWQHEFTYTRRTQAEDITFPGTITNDDQSDLGDERTITIIDDSTPDAPATPSGYKLVSIRSEQLTDAGKWQHTYNYARRTNEEAVTMDGSNLADDPSDLADEQTIVLVQATDVSTATPPSTPSGLSLYQQSSKQIHDAATGAKWRNTYEYRRNTRQSEIEYDNSKRTIDPSALQDGELIAQITTSSTPPSDPTPVNTSLVKTSQTIKQLTGGKWLHIFEFGWVAEEERREFDASYITQDANDLNDREVIAVINTSSGLSTPSPSLANVKLYEATTKTLRSGKYIHIYDFRNANSKDEIENQNSRVTVDPSALQDGELIAQLTTSGTAPSDPTPSNASLVKTGYTSKKINDVSWLHTFEFGWVTNEDRIEFDNSIVDIDASLLKTEEVIAQIASSLPSTPSPSQSGMQLVATKVKTLRSGKNLYTFIFGYNTTQEQIEFGGTVYGAEQFSAKETVTTEVIATTVAGDAYRDSLFGVLRQDETFKEVAVRKIKSGQLEVKTTKSAYDIVLLPGSTHTYEDSVNGFPPGIFSGTATWGSSDCKIKIGKLSSVVVGGAGGATSGRIDPVRFWRTRGGFVVERRFSDTAANLDDYRFASQVGTVNNAAFLGYAAYGVMFEGSTIGYALPSGSDKNVLVVRYNFSTDSHLWFSDRNCSLGWVDTDSGITLGSTGYFDPTTIFDITDPEMWTIVWPDDSDFSGFIA